MKIITLFNNKGGVGKTLLAYHITYMLAEKGYRVLAVDLDPQANLSAMFLTEERANEVYDNGLSQWTVMKSIQRMNKGLGDVEPFHIEEVNDYGNIGIVLGDLELSLFEDKLSSAWSGCSDGDERAFRTTSAFYRAIQEAGKRWEADYVIVDVGPNLGALNRTVLISTDYVLMPTAADLFSLQGLKNIGVRLAKWRKEWSKRRVENPNPKALDIPDKPIYPLGYIVSQYSTRSSKPAQAFRRWANRIPQVFAQDVLGEASPPKNRTVENDPHCIAMLRNYFSMVPMAMEAKKPMFLLKPADGAIGAHFNAVRTIYDDFEQLVDNLLEKIASYEIKA